MSVSFKNLHDFLSHFNPLNDNLEFRCTKPVFDDLLNEALTVADGKLVVLNTSRTPVHEFTISYSSHGEPGSVKFVCI